MTLDPTIVEAVALALYGHDQDLDEYHWRYAGEPERKHARELARAALTVAAPLLRAQVLEEAAKVAEEYPCSARSALPGAGDQIAAAIRALKEQP